LATIGRVKRGKKTHNFAVAPSPQSQIWRDKRPKSAKTRTGNPKQLIISAIREIRG
jgi:hypothetical protein